MKVVLLGGTGTLGTALTERLYDRAEITCFSRGELAQKTMHAKFPKVRMVIGDVRDAGAVRRVLKGADVAFLLAAIKHVEVAEANPLEAMKTNVLGAVNVGEAAYAAGLSHVIYSNTDKAVLPITTYGYTKALAQNYLLSLNDLGGTRFSAFNWGNVLASRGSAIHTFVKCLSGGSAVPITHPDMSRFWLTIDAAADFMLDNYKAAPTDRAMIPPIKAARVVRVIESIARLMGVQTFALSTTGIRGTEKIHEVLESTHAGCLRSDTCEQYTDQELDELIGPCVERILSGEAEQAADSRKPWRDGASLYRDPPQLGSRAPTSGRRRRAATGL
jgi:UDP-N-acetylglucosamine 4,6-dehydratase/5-epimerase